MDINLKERTKKERSKERKIKRKKDQKKESDCFNEEMERMKDN